MSYFLMADSGPKKSTGYILNGQDVSREEWLADCAGVAFGQPLLVSSDEGWPIHSSAAKVHPRQIPEAIESARRRGVRIDFDKKGRPIFESPGIRRST